jgi:N-acetyl-S-(2-succino)cysteine monooxygenase
MKKRVARAGRDPESVKILPGFMPIVGATEDDANRFATEMADFVDAEVGMAALKWQLDNAMIEDLPLDEPIPTDRLTDPDCVEASRARYEMFYRLAVEQKYTLRQLIQLKARSSGHAAVIGTAEQVAEHMIEWFTNQACDGFNLQPAAIPDSLDDIEHGILPILRERGYFRRDYTGSTLREHLGLARPDHVFSTSSGD